MNGFVQHLEPQASVSNGSVVSPPQLKLRCAKKKEVFFIRLETTSGKIAVIWAWGLGFRVWLRHAYSKLVSIINKMIDKKPTL
jgi:hypothetical protein